MTPNNETRGYIGLRRTEKSAPLPPVEGGDRDLTAVTKDEPMAKRFTNHTAQTAQPEVQEKEPMWKTPVKMGGQYIGLTRIER